LSKFSQLNQDINRVLDKLVSNQDLCKLLYYTNDSPLDESDIQDTSSLLYSLIFPYPISVETFKDDDGNPIAKTIINILFDDFELGKTNNKFKSSKLVFIILCHTSLWRLSDSTLRPFCILDQIDQMFSDQRVLGIGKGEFNGWRISWANDDYVGYKFVVKNFEFA
jgi:hypothetical protein